MNEITVISYRTCFDKTAAVTNDRNFGHRETNNDGASTCTYQHVQELELS